MEGDAKTDSYTVEVKINNATGHRVSEVWKLNGVIHRKFGPAVRKFSEIDGALFIERWMINGQGHRDNDQPQEIIRDSDTGMILDLTYMIDGKTHRDGDKPARISYHCDTATVSREEYFKNGERHRNAGPAIIVYDAETGQVSWQHYYKNGFKLNVPGISPNWP